jgi:hypothetical protein
MRTTLEKAIQTEDIHTISELAEELKTLKAGLDKTAAKKEAAKKEAERNSFWGRIFGHYAEDSPTMD